MAGGGTPKRPAGPTYWTRLPQIMATGPHQRRNLIGAVVLLLGFSGLAQLRLSSFIRRFPSRNVSENSICNANGYPRALSTITSNIVSNFSADCLDKAPKTTRARRSEWPATSTPRPRRLCPRSCCRPAARSVAATLPPIASPGPSMTPLTQPAFDRRAGCLLRRAGLLLCRSQPGKLWRRHRGRSVAKGSRAAPARQDRQLPVHGP